MEFFVQEPLIFLRFHPKRCMGKPDQMIDVHESPPSRCLDRMKLASQYPQFPNRLCTEIQSNTVKSTNSSATRCCNPMATACDCFSWKEVYKQYAIHIWKGYTHAPISFLWSGR
jgi:hypothetical protein